MSAFQRAAHSWLTSMVHVVEAEARLRSVTGPGPNFADLARRLRGGFADDERLLGRLLDGVEEALWQFVRQDGLFARWYLTERLRHALSLLDEHERLIRRGSDAGLYGEPEFRRRMAGVQRDRRRLRMQLDEAEV